MYGSTICGSDVFLLNLRSDWLLKFLYRTSSRQTEVAGLQPIEWHDRRMINIDLTSLISGHLDYRTNMNAILPAVGLRWVGVRVRFRLRPQSDAVVVYLGYLLPSSAV